MDFIVKLIKKEKREQMMIDMMPLMMEGIDMNELMPKMMANMLKDVTADDIIEFIKGLAQESDKVAELGTKIAETNLLTKMMMKTWRSTLSFDDTIKALQASAQENSWHIPDSRDLTKLWTEQGIENPPKIHILYFCNAQGGHSITKDDELKAMSVMMPMGVSVYETSEGNVEIAGMNLSIMGGMFTGETRETLLNSAKNLENCIKALELQPA
jgi:uncharacterized protein (DUF302 family)